MNDTSPHVSAGGSNQGLPAVGSYQAKSSVITDGSWDEPSRGSIDSEDWLCVMNDERTLRDVDDLVFDEA